MTWERKEVEGHLAHLDVRALLHQREFLGIPEALATQVSSGFASQKLQARSVVWPLPPRIGNGKQFRLLYYN